MSNGETRARKDETVLGSIEQKFNQLAELLASIKNESGRLKDKLLGEEEAKDTSPERPIANGALNKFDDWLSDLRQDALAIQENVTHLNNATG